MSKVPPGEVAKETNLKSDSGRESHSANLSRFKFTCSTTSEDRWLRRRVERVLDFETREFSPHPGPRHVLV